MFNQSVIYKQLPQSKDWYGTPVGIFDISTPLGVKTSNTITPTTVKYYQKAYDDVENRWHHWVSDNSADTSFNNFPGTDSTPTNYVLLKVI